MGLSRGLTPLNPDPGLLSELSAIFGQAAPSLALASTDDTAILTVLADGEYERARLAGTPMTVNDCPGRINASLPSALSAISRRQGT